MIPLAIATFDLIVAGVISNVMIRANLIYLSQCTTHACEMCERVRKHCHGGGGGESW